MPQLAEGLAAATASSSFFMPQLAKCVADDSSAALAAWLQLWRRACVAGCKENGPLAHLLWILVFDDQHNQIGLMNLQVFVL